MQIRTMNWNENTWLALRRAAAYIPPAVRMEAVMVVVRASEEEAKGRESPVVEHRDLALAAQKKIPTTVRAIALSVLEELGVSTLNKY